MVSLKVVKKTCNQKEDKMSEQYFSESEIEDAVYGEGYEVVSEESYGSGRWNEHMVSVVRTDDGKLYRISWDKALTEVQEDMFFPGKFPEVFKRSDVEVHAEIRYLTQEELDRTAEDTLEADIESLKLVSDEDAVEDCFTEDSQAEIRSALELLDKLETLDEVKNFKNNRIAAQSYLQEILDYSEGLR